MAANIIDLNTASEQEIASIPGVGPDRAKDLIANRPYTDWDEVAEVPGVSESLIEDMIENGVTLGSEADTEPEEDLDDIEEEGEEEAA
jgi:DNA uptake protein ComE-like DNA-binding protein